MLLCLSSGYRPRYRHDVLRAISMPEGSHLQFRYEANLIPEGLHEKMSTNKLANAEVCVAYLDRSDPAATPEIVPCRLATLIESHISGDIYILKLCLREFLVAKDIKAFNIGIRTAASNLPYWHEKELRGSFCQEMTSLPTSIRKTKAIGDWQILATTLKQHKDFANDPFFYLVQSLSSLDSNQDIEMLGNTYSVDANKSYQMTIIQYCPGGELDVSTIAETYWLLARNEDAQISFTTTKEIAVDSPYDEKKIRFRVSNPTHLTDSLITLLRQISPGSPDSSKAVLDFDLALTIKPSSLLLFGKGVTVGALISVQGIAAIYLNPNIADKWLGYVIVGLAGLITGIIASFGIRKL